MPTTVGIVHPGEMGSAIGACLAGCGHQVIWASAGRSAATAKRADDAGLADVGTLDQLVAASDVVISVCPPHAASALGRELRGFRGTFVEANAVSPRTVRDIAAVVTGAGAACSYRLGRAGAQIRRNQGLAMGRRDGADRRHLRRRRFAGRIPPSGGRDIPAAPRLSVPDTAALDLVSEAVRRLAEAARR
jgi:hypothetical protein